MTFPSTNDSGSITRKAHLIGGSCLVCPDISTLNSWITSESANVALDSSGYSYCIWPQGVLIRVAAEADGVFRRWDRTAGTPNALSAVLPNGKTITLAANTNTVFATTGSPSNGTGANGDYALDISNANIYGPKAGGAWTIPLKLYPTSIAMAVAL